MWVIIVLIVVVIIVVINYNSKKEISNNQQKAYNRISTKYSVLLKGIMSLQTSKIEKIDDDKVKIKIQNTIESVPITIIVSVYEEYDKCIIEINGDFNDNRSFLKKLKYQNDLMQQVMLFNFEMELEREIKNALNINVETPKGTNNVSDKAKNSLPGEVKIGEQIWATHNLNVDVFRNGDLIPQVRTAEEWEKFGEEGKPACCFFNNDPEMGQHYGRLYNWHAVKDSRGLAPAGWHVPSNASWWQLTLYLASQGFPNWKMTNGAGDALKSCRQVNSPIGLNCNTTEHPRWNHHDKHHGLDKFRFSALPGGYRHDNGGFYSIGYCGEWWSSTEDSLTEALGWHMNFNIGNFERVNYYKSYGFSVRCLKDNVCTED